MPGWHPPDGGVTGGELISYQPARKINKVTIETVRPDLIDPEYEATLPSRHTGLVHLDPRTFPNAPRNIRFSVTDYGTEWPYWTFHDDDTGGVFAQSKWLVSKAEKVIKDYEEKVADDG